MPEFLSSSEVASLIGVTVGTLANWRTSNRGPRWRRIGSMVRYERSDVLAWIDQNVEIHETRDTRKEQFQ